jgi:hypothetical protein
LPGVSDSLLSLPFVATVANGDPAVYHNRNSSKHRRRLGEEFRFKNLNDSLLETPSPRTALECPEKHADEFGLYGRLCSVPAFASRL